MSTASDNDSLSAPESANESVAMQTVDSGMMQSQEYETQYFGFTPKSFSDGLYNAVNEFTFDCLQEFINCLKTEYGDRATSAELRNAKKQIMDSLSQSMNRIFDKFENYIFGNVFHIPNNVVLPEDTVHMEDDVSKPVEDSLEADISDLEQQIINAKYVNSTLCTEVKDMDIVLQKCASTLAFLEELEKICHEKGLTSIGETLTFLNGQLEAHRRIVNQMPLQPDSRTEFKDLNGITRPQEENVEHLFELEH